MYLDTERRMEFLHKSLLFNLHHKSIQIHFQLLTQIPHTAALTLWGFIIANNQMYQRHKYIYHFFLIFILIWFPPLNKYNQTFTMEITKLEHSTLPSYPINVNISNTSEMRWNVKVWGWLNTTLQTDTRVIKTLKGIQLCPLWHL